MSTDDTVNAYMRNVGELAGVRHRAEKAEARIAELERERDELNEDVRSFERELTTIARRPDRRQGESRVCFWLRRIGEQLAEEADRTEKMKTERDAALKQAADERDNTTDVEVERDELRAALGKIALLGEYDGPVVAGSYIDLARAALKVAGR
jgi:vacuolar-type H+-ATPase subunit I/STV1